MNTSLHQHVLQYSPVSFTNRRCRRPQICVRHELAASRQQPLDILKQMTFSFQPMEARHGMNRPRFILPAKHFLRPCEGKRKPLCQLSFHTPSQLPQLHHWRVLGAASNG